VTGGWTGRLRRALHGLAEGEEEFRRLDAAAGDGDLGVTVRSGAEVLGRWIDEHAAPAPPGTVLSSLAEALGAANPSTFGSLIARGMSAAARSLGDDAEPGAAAVAAAFEAGIAMVQRRGGAAPGEKTVLDALIPALEALRAAGTGDGGELLRSMRDAAAAGTGQHAGEVAQHGRAAWVGERSRGVPDAGCVVVVRFLEQLAEPGLTPWRYEMPETAR
jgi:dihydroxyacetone kinase